MAPSLNLAALTSEELTRLLGPDAAQKLLPDLSQARMQDRPYRGPQLPPDLRFEPQAPREWGATAVESRRLRALREEFQGLGYAEHGVYYVPGQLGARHQQALTGDGDTAAALRWSETPESVSEPPFVQLLTLLRDRASGFAAVLTTGGQYPLVPAPSEEVAVRALPGAGALELHGAHRAEVLRHGRGTKLVTFNDWERAWQALRALNYVAWTRRGLLLDDVKETR
ncbi:hypothetical protein [Deinococcus pimensis]|uniref:hypothetical protein n=1 Tax=Deinococcus pimensis TaxID=309888 RepID=UPI0004847D49|nr:hypothetical protein [Deinococcus pimensis]